MITPNLRRESQIILATQGLSMALNFLLNNDFYYYLMVCVSPKFLEFKTKNFKNLHKVAEKRSKRLVRTAQDASKDLSQGPVVARHAKRAFEGLLAGLLVTNEGIAIRIF